MMNTLNKQASFPCCAPKEASIETPAEAEEITRRRLIVRSAARTDILRYVRYLLEENMGPGLKIYDLREEREFTIAG